MNAEMINELKQAVLSGKQLTPDEALALSKTNDKETLYACADELRLHFCGNRMDLCSITNAKSGKCSEDCKWCSQSAFHKTDIKTYDRIDRQEAIDQARLSAEGGVHKHSLVISGRRVSSKELDELVGLYTDIQKSCKVSLCASMGLLTKEQLIRLKEAGVKDYHCNLETAPSFFPNLCSTHTINEKIETIRWAQEVGLGVCSGGIIGMGENMQHRIELAFALNELNILSIPINILNPIEGTPLQGASPLTEEEILTTIALFRFINPRANIRFAGGRMQIKAFQHKALRAGINAALVGDLLTTIGSSVKEDIEDFTKAGFSVS